ncbi:PREDICTED: uncharacterized protein LOC107193654 [Dufourea novaeangliae]|uniref:uncharacterized protein LOC107193654 n=1 Tax=Dufourea novaeangliae TaxID=178035 RepID=UPI000767D4B1|nr:PREDICTED: uncharacterized protein LOC107193654 [Dufourea novaeangliae]
MISGLLKRARLYGQLTVNVLLNPVNQVANFIIPCDNSQLFVVTRNVTSSTGIHTQNKEKLSEKLKNMEIRMLQSRWTNKIEIEHVLNDISSKDDIGPSEALLVLRWCDKIMDCLPLERVKFGEYVWSHLFVCNIPLGVHHYNELLQIYLQNDYDFSPEKFLKEMANNGISPNIITYEKCIRYCCKKRKYDLATQFMRHMMNQNLTPTESILDILMIMRREFKVVPCIETISDYVLPFSFGTIPTVRKLLSIYGIDKVVIDNAYVLFLLKQYKSIKADYYMNIYPGPYMYNAIGDELREVYIFRSDVRNYVNIGVKLVHHSCPNVESIENIASLKRINPVSIDRHILDYMFYYPKDHKRLIKIITYLAETNYKITDSTARKVYNFIKPHGTYNVDSMLKRISNKMRNVQID